jgi:hypothetical protein
MISIVGGRARNAAEHRIANTMADKPANTPRPQLSSVFDDMLAESKERFGELYRGGSSRAGAAAADARPFATRTAPPARAATGFLAAKVDPQSAAARWLNERFGTNWRYEIGMQKREGDEAIVLGKLTFGRDLAIRTQFGRARIAGDALAAASGGVRFKLGGTGSEHDEREAFRRAAEAALSNCIDLI